ncbi:MAG: DNA ligase D, partial [Coriobacteriia bacterium]
VIVDGEVVVIKPDGSNSFQALQNLARRGEQTELTYMVFDLLYLDGIDLRNVALEDRKSLLQALITSSGGHLRYTDHIEGRGDVFFEQACTHSLEGVVSKRRDAAYRGGRGREWAKTKCLQEQEFVIVGYTDPGGTRSAFGALVLAVHENGDLRQVGRVGTGFSDASLADIHARLTKIERKDAPVTNPPRGAQAASIHWVEPELVAQVTFTEWTDEGSLRHPAFRGLRDDKPADEVIAEEPVELPQTLDPGSKAGAEDPAPVDDPARGDDRPGKRRAGKQERPVVAGVSISNPDRVLWPDVQVTKLELARYYESVAELMLPHVANRPLSLVRCPAGYTKECFYQKHIQHFPQAVDTVDIYEPEDNETVPYAKITSLGSIVGLVQMGVLEIHPWGSRADDPDAPDRLIFDLDPDMELPWQTVAGTALLIRSELDRLGLKSWLKTTGGKGLHVTVPIVRRQTWSEARDFSKAFVDHVVAIEPRLFTASMRKSDRGGKIFIDYVRNTRGATAVAAYSTRARPGAPVSVPLFWDEAESAEERPEFTIRNLADRLETLRGDPWAELPRVRQSITRSIRSQLGL